MDINRVLVVGAGAMGSQIALVSARAGLSVSCHDIDAARLARAVRHLRNRSARDIAKGNRSATDEDAAFARLEFGTNLTELAVGADFVIEAALEDLDVKRDLFANLDRHTPSNAILATNSSGFMPSQLADATRRPGQVCNVHFFNPALVMECVEIVAGPATTAATIDTAIALVQRLGKTPVVLDKEIPGFIANRILNAVRDEAISLYENDIASVDAIDTACRTALGYPMGPFELMDLTGIDIGYHVKQARFNASQDPIDAPSRTVTQLVEQGHLGRKTGRGFYAYDNSGNKLAPAIGSVNPPGPLDT
ncbi:3-hydroxyacyl-CoA dehydrogenase family protein [Mycobacterium sp. 21AC1]|uniref:3-hydroxyacyl-CoA dehydrogenase family protein n=1 Tax=[Mycobacterium] appelbergii TaxID=2939269 RepID=UPI0029392DAE|nr:3-hydroxyacyl-CoA dehydrogenase family protein [Mycobacterium sp. 21AC1]MDV3128393.1 3-hydroxyacyl-CoA dehydrogenase family protein [Mycobacterium sp. 21AC1]